MNILTAHPVSSQLEVNVTYGSYKSFNPYWFSGYAGRLARFQQAKEILDDQVSMDLLTIVESCYCGTPCVVTEQTSFRDQAD